MNKITFTTITFFTILQLSCVPKNGKGVFTNILKDNTCFVVPPQNLCNIENENKNFIPVNNSGFGSAISIKGNEEKLIYLLADCGPCFTNKAGEKVFIYPNYIPNLGVFKFNDTSLILIEKILLKDKKNRYFSGVFPEKQENNSRPHKQLSDSTINSIDPEGLIVLDDKTFWISEEYGPSIIHFDINGKEIERYSISNSKIPKVFSKRKQGRSMEGLTITPNGKKLIGIIQSTLANTLKNEIKNKRLTRILVIDIGSGESSQYAYIQDYPENSNCEILALSETKCLILERDSGFLNDSKKKSKSKRVYLVDFSFADDISGKNNSSSGLLINGKTIEETDEFEFLSLYKPVLKYNYPVVDLISKKYIHDKCEGMAIMDNKWLVISNDDDFGIMDSSGILTPKFIKDNNGQSVLDRNYLYFFSINLLNLNTQ